MQVAAILANKGRSVVTAKPGTSIPEIAQVFKSKKIGAAVVVDDGETVVGIISERDLVHGLARHGARLLDMHVGELMTREVKTCGVELDVDAVMKVMTESRFRHLPVIEGGRLAGIVSIGDVVKHRLDELEAEASQLKRYIATG
ncbi:MAG: CBS domain-containing protein [Candidatus Eiseniibacteriota bacterium]